MPRIDMATAPVKTGSIYPPPLDELVKGRSSLRLGQAGGLTQFGVNVIILEPGARSSIRHWHENEDEFVWVLEGEVILHDDTGVTRMGPGDCAAFPAGDQNGHCFTNLGAAEARFLVIGSRAPREIAHYPDHDMKVTLEGGVATFTTEAGAPLPGRP